MWYVFQLAVICGIVYLYETEIPHPNETLGHVVALGVLTAYCLTWIIVRVRDLLATAARYCRRTLAGRRTTQ